jgi:type III secretion protein R
MNFSDISPAYIIVIVISVALAPFVAVMVTSFTKIVVVLSLLKNALGLQQVPPSVVVNGLALILSVYVMYPVGLQISDEINKLPPTPVKKEFDLNHLAEIVDVSKEPLRTFLIKHTSDSERAFFLRTAQKLLTEEKKQHLSDRDFIIVIPAFTVSELSAAFQIGLLIFLPFLIVDLIISNILLAMGMMMLSPTTVSLPFKLLLFVLIDGWSKLIHGLVLTYR